VSLSAANDHASLPLAYQLYLPKEWADDPARRAKAGVPDNIVFQTKPQITLDQLRAAVASGIGAEVVLADAGYGNDTDFRGGITELGLAYVVGIMSSTSVWPPGMEPLPPKPWSGNGRPTSAIRRGAEHHQATGTQPSQKCLAAGYVLRRDQHKAHLALRRRAGPSRSS
jgi:SRSO17 transposase